MEQVKLPGDASYKVARELYRQHSKTDSLLIQERWRSVAYIQELEDDTQKPALSSTAASLWWLMHVLGIKVPIPASVSFCAASQHSTKLPKVLSDARVAPPR